MRNGWRKKQVGKRGRKRRRDGGWQTLKRGLGGKAMVRVRGRKATRRMYAKEGDLGASCVRERREGNKEGKVIEGSSRYLQRYTISARRRQCRNGRRKQGKY